MNRRRFIQQSAAASAASLTAASLAAATRRDQQASAVFKHGVASGDPLAAAVIIWTRVTPTAAAAKRNGLIDVQWRVASDARMRKVVAKGSLTTHAVMDYTVKVDVGGLTPGHSYFYQFTALGEQSAVGRTRTAAAQGTPNVTFAVASCANYPFGHFNVYRRIAERENLDAVLHLGDYFYEYDAGTYAGKLGLRSHFPEHEVLDLPDYRARHAQYKTDPDLQAAHQAHPWICVWDDHESANNSWVDGAQNHNEGEGRWDLRKQAAIQAYYEWMPIREQPMSVLVPGIYRAFRFGDSVDLIMLDTRLHGRSEQVDKADTKGIADPGRTLLGHDQLAWLQRQLQASSQRGAQWRVLGQQCMFAQLLDADGAVLNADQWDGYAFERAKILDQLRDQRINDTVVLTGDIHSCWANDLTHNPFADGYDGTTGRGSLATELVTPSVTSPSPFGDTEAARKREQEVIDAQPHMHWVNFRQRGYIVVEFSPEQAQADWWLVDTVAQLQHHESRGARMINVRGSNHLVAG